MKIEYVSKGFTASSLEVIDHANHIIIEYMKQGYILTLRQLFYQFVARGLIANKQRQYKRLGSILNDARLAGMIDWKAIEDRTRNLSSPSSWDNVQQILNSCARGYHLNRWKNGDHHVEVWVEKEALAGVIQRAAIKWDCPSFCCRGYTSQSEMHGAAMRLLRNFKDGKHNVIIYLGDHDPSGIHMTEDVINRMKIFLAHHLDGYVPLTVNRVALNWDQVQEYDPPPNPVKMTDSRAGGYQERFGDESWELDALDPSTLSGIIQDAITPYVDHEIWDHWERQEEEDKKGLKKLAKHWDDVIEIMNGAYEE